MNGQEIMAQSKQTAKEIIMGIFWAMMFVVVMLIILQISGTSNGLAAQKKILDNLNSGAIKQIVLTPYHDTYSLINRETVIKDSSTINQLIRAYKNMRPEKAGDGRLPGDWQMILTFIMRDGTEIETEIHHNDFADLVFIPTPDRLNYSGSDDFYASHEISLILIKKLASK